MYLKTSKWCSSKRCCNSYRGGLLYYSDERDTNFGRCSELGLYSEVTLRRIFSNPGTKSRLFWTRLTTDIESQITRRKISTRYHWFETHPQSDSCTFVLYVYTHTPMNAIAFLIYNDYRGSQQFFANTLFPRTYCIIKMQHLDIDKLTWDTCIV